MVKMFRMNKKGFTLTELIVVVAILGVLAAVVTPSVVGYLSDAKKNADEANAATLDGTVKRMVAKGILKMDTAVYPDLSAAAAKAAIKAIIQREINPYPVLNDTTNHYVLQRMVDSSGICAGVSVQLLGTSTAPVAPTEGINIGYIE